MSSYSHVIVLVHICHNAGGWHIMGKRRLFFRGVKLPAPYYVTHWEKAAGTYVFWAYTRTSFLSAGKENLVESLLDFFFHSSWRVKSFRGNGRQVLLYNIIWWHIKIMMATDGLCSWRFPAFQYIFFQARYKGVYMYFDRYLLRSEGFPIKRNPSIINSKHTFL